MPSLPFVPTVQVSLVWEGSRAKGYRCQYATVVDSIGLGPGSFKHGAQLFVAFEDQVLLGTLSYAYGRVPGGVLVGWKFAFADCAEMLLAVPPGHEEYFADVDDEHRMSTVRLIGAFLIFFCLTSCANSFQTLLSPSVSLAPSSSPATGLRRTPSCIAGAARSSVLANVRPVLFLVTFPNINVAAVFFSSLGMSPRRRVE